MIVILTMMILWWRQRSLRKWWVRQFLDLAHMGRNAVTILVLSGLITSIEPVIAIFPVLGFVVNIIAHFRIMKLEYDFDVEKKTIMRRANYSKRVFYQPEYAKEIKLSHRLSTTRDADCIYMFENGEIIEQGTHQELMARNGQYAKMFRCQAKYYQENVEVFG